MAFLSTVSEITNWQSTADTLVFLFFFFFLIEQNHDADNVSIFTLLILV